VLARIKEREKELDAFQIFHLEQVIENIARKTQVVQSKARWDALSPEEQKEFVSRVEAERSLI
jgi:hypothetical protein